MDEIMLTSGDGFDGYEIVEYLGFIKEQVVFTSNLLTNIAEWSTQEHSGVINKLDNASSNALDNLIKAAGDKNANAIIGVSLSYSGVSGFAIGAIVTGTAVRICKKSYEQTITSRIDVTNYYNMKIPRPVYVDMIGDDKTVKIAPTFYNYEISELKAVRCDIEFTNVYEEKLILKDMDFVFEKSESPEVQARFVECKLPVKVVPLIKDVKVYISKYVTAMGIFTPDADPINITLSKYALEQVKENRGIDAVEKYKSDGVTWICSCGYINAAEDKECAICQRTEEELKSIIDFDYEEMYNKMKRLPTVASMKDVLMDYIKQGSIDVKYRMELLEIMESGLQYEKTKGSMADVVIEKVRRVFEGD